MTGHNDQLLEETRRRLQELERKEEDGQVDWGERVELDPGESFVGRWRGESEGRSRDGGTFVVFLLWDRAGEHRFLFRTTRLGWEIDELRPTIGDEIAIVRGSDLPAQSGRSPTQRYAVRAKTCADPLPGHSATVEAEDGDDGPEQLTIDDDIPF